MKQALLAVGIIVTFAAVCSAQGFTYYYPHVVTGTYPGGWWQTTIFITNSSQSGTPATGTISFRQSDGNPLNLAFVDEINNPVSNGTSISFALAGGESRKYISVASGPQVTGFATVTATAAVMGTAMFTQFDASGRMLGEAGVPAAIPLGRQAIFVDTTNGFKTGVAIANPNNSPLHTTFELMTTTGQVIMSTIRDIGPNQHTAFFIHELFPEAPPLVGRLQFYCLNPMTSVALRFDPGFVLFTTMPPIAIAGMLELSQTPFAILPRRYGLLESV
jgi:hypothetical protein